jgi:hypothetical protein
MKLGKDSALEKLRTSKDDLILALKEKSATWDSFDDKEAHEILNNINAIKIVELGVEDVIRHPIVAQIIKAYDIKR